MRAFVAVDLPDRLADAVADVQADLPDTLRPTDPEQAHATLKFLGDVDPDRLAEGTAVESAVETAVAASGVDPFEMRVGGLGVFPSLDYVSVVWLGVDEGEEALTRLHEAIERETVEIGFDPADHEFTPHVTVARMDDARGKEEVRRLVRETAPTIGRFRVDEVRIKTSVPCGDGPRHDTVARVPL